MRWELTHWVYVRIFNAAVLNATYKSLNRKHTHTKKKPVLKMNIPQGYSFKQIKAIISDHNSASLATAELPLV